MRFEVMMRKMKQGYPAKRRVWDDRIITISPSGVMEKIGDNLNYRPYTLTIEDIYAEDWEVM